MTCDLLSTHAYVFEYGHSTDTAVCIALKCWKTVDMERWKVKYTIEMIKIHMMQLYFRCILENNMTKDQSIIRRIEHRIIRIKNVHVLVLDTYIFEYAYQNQTPLFFKLITQSKLDEVC